MFLVLLLLGAAAPAQAGREPVLKQVDLPHSYYWRELYIPQLTTGPVERCFHARRPRADLQHGGFAVAAGDRQRTRRSS